MVQESLGCFCPIFILILNYRRRSCSGGGGGAILSGTWLSGWDRGDKESNLFWVSGEDEISNKVLEMFGIQMCYSIYLKLTEINGIDMTNANILH